MMISKIKKSKKVKFMTNELQKKIVWQNINSSKEKGKILKGKMYFETTDGVGTIFYIELPINKEEN